jgi:hypothetical protein
MACDPDNRTIYATKGSRTLEFYSYSPADSGWTRHATVPAGSTVVVQAGKRRFARVSVR